MTLAILLSGCAKEVTLPADADAELRSGADIYRSRCASCHSADGSGALGPSLLNVGDQLDSAGQREVVVNGRKAMPAFGATLSEADVDAVIRYTREIL